MHRAFALAPMIVVGGSLAVAPTVVVGCSLAVDLDRFNAGGPSFDGGETDTKVEDANPDAPKGTARVFVAGGNVAGTNESTVLRADVSDAGDVVGWTELPDRLPASASTTQAARVGPHVFILGPDFVTSNAVTVRFAKLDPSGHLSPWSGAKTLVPHGRLSVAATRKFLYAIGGTPEGSDNAAAVDVFVASVDDSGVPSSFTPTRPLPAPRAGACAVAVDSNVYVFGGNAGSGSSFTTVFRARVNADGSLGEWSAQQALPFATLGCSAVSVGRRVFVLGGYGAQDKVQHALVDASGDLSPWVTGPPMPSQHAYFQAVVVRGFVIAAAGFKGASTPSAEVDVAPIAEGGIGTWKKTTALPKARVFLNAFGSE